MGSVKRLPEGFHIDSQAADSVGLTREEVLEERRAAKERVNHRGPRAGSRRAPTVKNPFDEVLRSLGLWERVSAVCKEHGVAVHEIGTESKARRLVVVRKKVYGMLRELGWGYVDIGKLFDREHSTVMAALK